jgi:hypothetical protein
LRTGKDLIIPFWAGLNKYRTEMNLPQESTVQDLDIPASAGRH